MTSTFHREDGANISAALVRAIAEAKVLADAGEIGAETHNLVQHPRELYARLLEQFAAAGLVVPEEFRGRADAMGNKRDQPEALITRKVIQPELH